MLFPLASFVLSLGVAVLGVLLVGVNLGGAFAIVVTGALVTPLIASAKRELKPSILADVLAGLGAGGGSSLLLIGSAFSIDQAFSIAITTLALSLALAAVVRGLMWVRVSPLLAGAISVVLALAWLSWPIWLSPWLKFPSAEAVATRLSAVHPLLAINAIAPQFGYWVQSRQMYRLTSIGQDVNLSLPESVWPCAVFHLIIALAICLPLLAMERTRLRRRVVNELPSAR